MAEVAVRDADAGHHSFAAYWRVKKGRPRRKAAYTGPS
jgi:hypothetical protein